MAKYIYPALFHPEKDGGYSISFPDIQGCYTCGDDLEDGINMAEDVLPLMLVEMEDKGEELPRPSAITDLNITSGDFATMIHCDTTKYRHVLHNMTVKKTLSIPSWLNDSAIEAGIDFSLTLQEAIMGKLDLA